MVMMANDFSVNGEFILRRSETYRKGRQTKSTPVFISRMEKHQHDKSVYFFDIRNVLDVKALLKDIRENWHTYVSQIYQWIQKNPVKKMIVTGIFTIVLGFFTSNASAAFIQEYTYQVKSGDTIENIAVEHGVTAQEILDANGITSINGKKILLPKVQDQTVTATALNVRSQPSTASTIIDSYKKGDIVKVSFVENGWAGILINGRVCYVSADYLTQTQTAPATSKPASTAAIQPKTMYVTTSLLRVRNAATTNSAIAGLLKLNDQVSVNSIVNGWAQINFNGKTAYVSAGYLTNSEPSKTMYVTATSLRVRKTPSASSSILGSLKLNDQVAVKSISNGWALVPFNGQAAYVSADYLTKNAPIKMNVTLKSNMSNPSPSVYVIKKGDTFTKIAKSLGISVLSIQELNPTINSSKLIVGQQIKIPSASTSNVTQMTVTAQIGGVDPQGTFRFITTDGSTYSATASGSMINELFTREGKKATLTLAGNRGQQLTLISLQ